MMQTNFLARTRCTRVRKPLCDDDPCLTTIQCPTYVLEPILPPQKKAFTKVGDVVVNLDKRYKQGVLQSYPDVNQWKTLAEDTSFYDKLNTALDDIEVDDVKEEEKLEDTQNYYDMASHYSPTKSDIEEGERFMNEPIQWNLESSAWDNNDYLDDYGVGAITVNGEFEVTRGLVDYTIRGKHNHHIVQVPYEENFDNEVFDWKIYWMPTFGYCTYFAHMMDLVVKKDINYFKTASGTHLLAGLVGLLGPPHYKNEYKKEDYYHQYEFLKDEYCKVMNISKPQPELKYQDFVDYCKTVGLPLAEPGVAGVVLCKRGNVLHCGYKTKLDFVDKVHEVADTAEITHNVLIEPDHNDRFVEFIYEYRNIYGGMDAKVTPAEMEMYFRVYGESFSLFQYDSRTKNISQLKSNVGFTLPCNNVLFFDTQADLEDLFARVWWKWEDIKMVAGNEDLESPMRESNPHTVIDIPTGKVVTVLDQSDWPLLGSSDSTRKDSGASTIKDPVKPQGPPDRHFDVSRDFGENQWIFMRGWNKVFRYYDRKYYFDGKFLVHHANPRDKYVCVNPHRDGMVNYLGINYLVLEEERLSARQASNGLKVVKLVRDRPQQDIDYDEFGYPLTVLYQADPSELHHKYITEWCLISGQYHKIKTEFTNCVRAARLYVSTAVKGDVSEDWVAYRLYKFVQSQFRLEDDTKNMGDRQFWRRGLNDRRWRTFCMMWKIAYYSQPIKFFSAIVLIMAFFIHAFMTHQFWISGVCFFLFLLILFYLETEIKPTYMSDFRVGRLDECRIHQELSYEKKAELYCNDKLDTPSLGNVRCYWKGVQIGFQTLLSKVKNFKKKFLVTGVSNLVPKEYISSLHKLAPSDMLGGLWAFIIRASTPLAEPQDGFRDLLAGYVRVKEFADEMNSYILTHDYIKFPDYVKSVLRRKRAAYTEGMERFIRRPFIPNTMGVVVKPDEKQHHNIGMPDAWSDKYKPRNIYNPSEQVKGVCGWIMQILMHAMKVGTSYADNFAAGKSPTELAAVLTRIWHGKRNPVFISWDGTRHDSLQHIWFLKDIDNAILKEVVPVICRLVGFDSAKTAAVLSNLTALHTDVELLQKIKGVKNKKLLRLLKAKVFGTVFSGHPSRTTWGNTTRILFLSRKAAENVGMIWNVDLFHCQAGDDTLIIMEEEWVDRYEAEIKRLYAGYGLRMQDFRVGQTFEFLSRNGFVEQGQVHLRRFEDRVTQTGLFSVKVGQDDMDEFDKAITKQISSWGEEMVGVGPFCRWRRSHETSTRGAIRVTSRVQRVLEDEWNIVNGSEQSVYGVVYAQEDRAYLALDACFGNPVLSWIKAA